METRPAEFWDTQRMIPLYGIKVKHDGKWLNAGDNNGQFLFESAIARDVKREDLKNKTIPI